MKRFLQWQVILALILVFLAGGVAGSMTTVLLFKRGVAHALRFEGWTDMAMRALRKDLKLTAEQEPKARVLVEGSGRQLKTTFAHAFQESGRILIKLGRDLDHELDPEQRAIRARKEEEFRRQVKRDLDLDLPPPEP